MTHLSESAWTRRSFLRTTGGSLAGLAWASLAGAADAGSKLPRSGCERRKWVDAETGVSAWQITSFPTVHENLYFHSRCWTADGKTFLFRALASASRDAATDLYSANVDGKGLQKLTTGRGISNIALHPSEPLVYFHESNAIHTLDIETGEIVRLDDFPEQGSIGGYPGSFTDDGRLYAFPWQDTSGQWGFGTFDLKNRSFQLTRLKLSGTFGHWQIEPAQGERVLFNQYLEEGKLAIFVADRSGRVEKLPLDNSNGHFAWLGPTGRVYTCILGDACDIIEIQPGQTSPRVLAKSAPNFWHAGVSPEGEWMVSDTLKPDAGLYLVNAKTGRHAKLFRGESSQGHSSYTHPHPSVGPGGRHALFNSDRTGVPHVYAVEIPESLREKLRG